MRDVYWVYQCPDPDCRLIGVLHGYEFTTKSTPSVKGSWVPCPQCREPMTKLRKAEETELENLVRLTRYSRRGPSYTIPLASFYRRSITTTKSDSREDIPGKRKVKTSIQALTYGLLRADQVGEILGMPVQMVRRLWRDEELGYIQFNKKQRLSNKEQIEEYIRSKTAVTALPSPTRPPVPVKNRQSKTPAKTSIEDVRRKLSSWDESSRSERDSDET